MKWQNVNYNIATTCVCGCVCVWRGREKHMCVSVFLFVFRCYYDSIAFRWRLSRSDSLTPFYPFLLTQSPLALLLLLFALLLLLPIFLLYEQFICPACVCVRVCLWVCASPRANEITTAKRRVVVAAAAAVFAGQQMKTVRKIKNKAAKWKYCENFVCILHARRCLTIILLFQGEAGKGERGRGRRWPCERFY